MPGALCVTMAFIGLGLMMIFARDLMWELTHFSNQTRGIESERTEVWDSMQILSGVVVIVVGIILSLMIFGTYNDEQQRNASGTATAQAHLAEVEQYGTPIATLQTVQEGEMRQIAARRLGLNASGVYYGRCASGSFYAFVFDPEYDYKALVYAPDSSPDYCHPEGVHVSQVRKIGNGWYDVWVSDSARTIQTSVARMLTPFASATPTPAPTRTAGRTRGR